MKQFLLCLSLLTLLTLAACGGSSNSTPAVPQVLSVSLTPAKANVLVNQTTKLSANVSVTGGASTAVTWSITEPNGGTINAGSYQAPWTVGTYHVTATSVADSTKSATATLEVSAKFAFIREVNVAPTSPAPFLTTPLIGTLNPDGSFTETTTIDPGTQQPVEQAVNSVHLSSDGTFAVFDMYSYMSGHEYFDLNIYTATADTTGSPVNLTNNVTDYSMAADAFPRLSQDGKTIVYYHEVVDAVTNNTATQIRTMKIDGSNKYIVADANPYGSTGLFYVSTPTISPDGTKVAFTAEQYMNNVWWTGIAVANADGSNLVQLTGQQDTICPAGFFGWDYWPQYTNDGSQISFNRECWSLSTYALFASTMIMNADGSNLHALLDANNFSGFIACPAAASGDTLILSTNIAAQGTDSFDLYSFMPDGKHQLVRLTTNNVFDGINTWWMNYAAQSTANAKKVPLNALQRRLDLRNRMLKRAGAVLN